MTEARVVVGMSGGVDSAVAALLLKQQGFDVVGVFMKNWDDGNDDACTAAEDHDDVRSVCDHIGIPYYTVNFTREYHDRVFRYFLDEYAKGRTPNPDILCNTEIKFDAFLNFALKIDASALATGHYARVEQTAGTVRLLRGADPNKDQSYFLHALKPEQLSRVLFPVGSMLKSEVRAVAREAGLPNAEKKDSTGICFIGERDFRAFLSRYLPATPGDIVTESGTVVGSHEGCMGYTIGQRKGLGIGGKGDGRPWFVLDKDVQRNRLIVAQGDDHPLLWSSELVALNPTFISGRAPAPDGVSFRSAAKIRYRQPDQACACVVEGSSIRVTFDRPQRAVAPGQSVVLYDGDVCLGGAVIESTAR